MIKVLIIGIAGRMGCEIGNIVYHDGDMEIVGGAEKEGHPSVGRDIGKVLGLSEDLGINVVGNPLSISNLMDEADVIIDFTDRESTMENIDGAAIKRVPVVIGTTGLTNDDLSYIEKCSGRMAILQSFNMSLGMNLLFALAGVAGKILSGYDAEIIEKHHKMKKDSPSGSAIKIGQSVANARNVSFDEKAVYSRHGLIGERTKGEIGIQTIRGGSITGEHTLMFIGEEEILEITHKAQKKSLFARGAVVAAKWVVNQGPGLYNMQDLLEL